MFVMKAKDIDKILSNLESEKIDPHQAEFQFSMHRDSMDFYTKNRNAIPTIKNYDDAASHIKEAFGIIVSREDVEVILSLFPYAKIKLAVYDGCYDTDVRDAISKAACIYFSGSDVPTYGDDIDINRFYDHLQNQAEKMGFSLDK